MVLNIYAIEPLMQKKFKNYMYVYISGKTTEINENNAKNVQEIRNTLKTYSKCQGMTVKMTNHVVASAAYQVLFPP